MPMSMRSSKRSSAATLVLVALALVFALAPPALAQGAPPAPPATEAPPAAPVPAPAPAPASAPPADVETPPGPGDITEVDGWRIVTYRGSKKLPDGRPALEACGWERDVVVERIGAGTMGKTGSDLKRGVLVVACAKDASGAVIPAKPTIRLMDVDAAAKPITDADIRAVIKRHERSIEACQKRDRGARGLLNVRWLVMPDGSTNEVIALMGTLKSAGVRECVIAEIKTWKFPTHAVTGGVPVDFAFGFDGPDSVLAKEDPGPPVCKPGEKPKAKKELAEGEVACVEKAARACAQGEKPLKPEQLAPGQRACVEMASDRGVPFLKGELTRFGDVQLTNVRSSFGVGIGVAAIDNVYYAQLRPDLNVYYGPFALGLGAPLRFEVANFSGVDPTQGAAAVQEQIFGNAGRFRVEDWDQVEDFLRPIKYLTWGKKEENIYASLNRMHSLTIGHGQLVRRYTPNVDIDEDRLMAAVDGYNDFGGVELMAGPFPVPRIAGGLGFIKPLSFFNPEDILSKSWSVGATYVLDLNTPTRLDSRLNPADQRLQVVVDETNQLVWPQRPNPVGDMVHGVGIDTEVKVLKLDFIDIKTYADYSHLFFPADSSAVGAWDAFSGGGFTLGGLIRMSFGQTPVRDIKDETEEVKAGRAPREMKAGHAVRFRLEGRTFAPTYLPSYFNTLYEIDRFQYGVADRDLRATLPTKIGFLASQVNEPWRAGVYTELSYAWVDAFGITAVYEDATALGSGGPVRARNVALHAETGGLGFLQLFATYHYRTFEDFGGMFSFKTDNEILYAGGRLEILPILFINVAAQRSFRVGFGDDDLEFQKDARGNRFSSIGFENVWAGTADVELGWQF